MEGEVSRIASHVLGEVEDKTTTSLFLFKDTLAYKQQLHLLLNHFILKVNAKKKKTFCFVCCEKKPSDVALGLEKDLDVAFVDCYSNPLQWLPSVPSTSSKLTPCEDISNLHSILQTIQRLLSSTVTSEISTEVVIVFDSFSEILHRHSTSSLCKMLQTLLSPNFVPGRQIAILGVLHADAHEENVWKTLQHFAATTISISSSTLESIEVSTIYKRKTKASLIKERYRIINNKTLEFEETIQKGREVKVQKQPKSKDPTENLTFNLKLTDEEKAAKQNVVLPYTHHLKGQQEEISPADTEEYINEEDYDPDDDLDI